jgi:hypothetical protein
MIVFDHWPLYCPPRLVMISLAFFALTAVDGRDDMRGSLVLMSMSCHVMSACRASIFA